MKRDLPKDYSSPTGLPAEEARPEWQARNRSWWETNPMRYDWKEPHEAAEFSREFYLDIDRRFFEDAQRYMPARVRPFDALIPFDELSGSDVLEIGVGNGSHAQLIAPFCARYTGIDLTRYAVRSSSRRLSLCGVDARILQMDAEQMAFADASFDLIWSWGVIHHSADTSRVLREMHRVLRPGGRAIVMVYHRSWLYTYVYAGLLRGVLQGGLRKHSLHELVQLNTDGAIARFYRPEEWRDLVEQSGFSVESQCIKGQKSEVILLPPGRVKQWVTGLLPDAAARFVTNTCQQGSFLITTLRKR